MVLKWTIFQLNANSSALTSHSHLHPQGVLGDCHCCYGHYCDGHGHCYVIVIVVVIVIVLLVVIVVVVVILIVLIVVII